MAQDMDEIHRKLGAEANDRGWDLAEQEARAPEEDAAMMDAVHAARWHWSKVGTATQIARADLLVAFAMAQVTPGEAALSLARKSRDALLPIAEPWEATLCHAICAVAGQDDAEAEADRAAAEAAFAEVPAGQVRDIVAYTMAKMPKA